MKKADVYNKNCPSRLVLDIISDKWVILIIEQLARKPHRFEELKRVIEGISPKVLSHLLKSLVSYGLVIRADHSDHILHVEYSLSPLGQSLSLVCNTITNWAVQHINSMLG